MVVVLPEPAPTLRHPLPDWTQPATQPAARPPLNPRCAGDKAYALDASLVGSIGVISATFGAVETAHRLVSRVGGRRRALHAGLCEAAQARVLWVGCPAVALRQQLATRLPGLGRRVHSS